MAEAALQTREELEREVAAGLPKLVQAAKRALLEQGDPEPFVRIQWPDVILDEFQWDIIRHAFSRDHREVFIKGCTKPGKGFAVALVVNIWFDVFPDSRVILTGPSFDHVKDGLFAEVVTQRLRMICPGPGECQNDRIKHTAKHAVRIANPKSGEGFSGMHAKKVLYVMDEASIVGDEFYEMAKKQMALLIALANPRTLSGWFREGFKDDSNPEFDPDKTQSIDTVNGRRRLVTVSGLDCRNVKDRRLENQFAPAGVYDAEKGCVVPGDFKVNGYKKIRSFKAGEFIPDDYYVHVKPVIPAQLDYARFLETMSHPDAWHRAIYGLGRFPTEDADLQVILSSWLGDHVKAWHQEIPITAFGLDVAASEHEDKTILAGGSHEGCRALDTRQGADVMETAGWVLDTTQRRYGIDLTKSRMPICIDYGGGYGRGVGDRLKEQGVLVIEMHPGGSPVFDKRRYENQRTEVYGELGLRLNPQGPWGADPKSAKDMEPWALPDDTELHADLCAPERIVRSDGVKFGLIPKEKPNSRYTGKTIKGKLGRSPDKGDAVTLLYRAVSSLENRHRTEKRSLVYVLESEPEQVEMTPEERRQADYNELVQSICASMDAEHDDAFERLLL